MKNAKLLVIRCTNRNGAVSWRLDGRSQGVRVRKNFKTREEAAAEKAALELKVMQATSGFRSGSHFSLNSSYARPKARFFGDAAGNDIGACFPRAWTEMFASRVPLNPPGLRRIRKPDCPRSDLSAGIRPRSISAGKCNLARTSFPKKQRWWKGLSTPYSSR
jgi:hypothetical protein